MTFAGIGYHHAGRHADAVASFERADAFAEQFHSESMADAPDRIAELRIRVLCLRALGRLDDAIMVLDRARAMAVKFANDGLDELPRGEILSRRRTVLDIDVDLFELHEEMGTSARLPPLRRVPGLIRRARRAAMGDRPDEAAGLFASAEALAGDYEVVRPRLLIAAADIAMSFARADRFDEAVAWHCRWEYWDAEKVAKLRERLLARCSDGTSLAIALTQQVREEAAFCDRLRAFLDSTRANDLEYNAQDLEDADLEDEDLEDEDLEDEEAAPSRPPPL
jgi:hypothetical protein